MYDGLVLDLVRVYRARGIKVDFFNRGELTKILLKEFPEMTWKDADEEAVQVVELWEAIKVLEEYFPTGKISEQELEKLDGSFNKELIETAISELSLEREEQGEKILAFPGKIQEAIRKIPNRRGIFSVSNMNKED